MKMFRARQAGFTLMELMITVAILSVATALAVPNFLRWQTQFQLRQGTSEIATQLILARMAGMNRNRGVVVTLQTVGANAHISAVTSDVPALWVINDTSLPTVPSIVGSPVTVSFSSMGLKTSGGTGTQTIGVCDAYKRQYSVTIIPTGKVNWSINSGGTPCP